MCYHQTMTDKGVNIEVPTAHIALEEVVGPQFEKMDIARLYRVAEGEMIKFENFPWPEWEREIRLLARHYYNIRRVRVDARSARIARNVSVVCAVVSTVAAVFALILSVTME